MFETTIYNRAYCSVQNSLSLDKRFDYLLYGISHVSIGETQ